MSKPEYNNIAVCNITFYKFDDDLEEIKENENVC